jgi:hypothetical protein
MTKTENLSLPQWEATDYVQRSDFNDAFASLDEGYSAAMAAAAQVTASLDGKADVVTVEAAQAACEGALALRGNCQAVYGTYTGNGKYGSSNANSLTFDHPPVLLLVGNYILSRCKTKNSADSGYNLLVAFSGNTVTWSCGNSAADQCNTSGTTYSYIALVDISQ